MSVFKFSRAQQVSPVEGSPAVSTVTPSAQEYSPDSAISGILQRAVSTQNAPLKKAITPMSTVKKQVPAPFAEPKRWITLFSDEARMKDRMMADWIDEITAGNELKDRRKELFGGDSKILPKEAEMLKRMAADGVTAKDAVQMIKDRRKETGEEPEGMSFAQQAFNVPVGALALATEQVGNVLDFAFPEAGFGEQVKEVKEINKPLEESLGYQIGRKTFGVGESIAAAPAKWMTTGGMWQTVLGRAAQGAVVGGYQGAAMPILEKGSEATMGDVLESGATGAAIWGLAGPVIEGGIWAVWALTSKGAKYGTALTRGGTEWLKKSIGRDIAALKAPAKPAIPAKNVFWEEVIPVELESPGIMGKVIDKASKVPVVGKVLNRVTGAVPDDAVSLTNHALGTKFRNMTSADKLKAVSEGGHATDLETLHGLVAKGEIQADLNTVYGGAEAVQSGLRTYGERIGNFIKQSGLDSTVDVNPVITKLDKITSNLREAQANPTIIELAEKYKKLLTEFPDLESIQATKWDIFQDLANIKKDNVGRQSYRDFMDAAQELIKQIDNKVEQATGNSAEFIRSKQIYKALKNIEKDITDSAVVSSRKSPMSLAEQLTEMQSVREMLTNPLGAVTNKMGRDAAKAIAERASRDGSFRRVMELFNDKALKRGSIMGKISNAPKEISGTAQTLTKKDSTPKTLNAIIKEGEKGGKVDMEKYLANASEASADKMATHAYEYAINSAIEGKNTLNFDKISKIGEALTSGKEGKVATVGDIITDPYLRKLYKAALDTPIEVSNAPGLKGSVGEFVIEGPKKGTIIFRSGSAETNYNLADTILHEAAHSIRLTKGRAMTNDYSGVTGVLKKEAEQVKKTKPKGLNNKRK